MSTDFVPTRGRIALNSLFAKGLVNKLNMECSSETKLYVNSEIEPCEIEYYNVDILSSKDLRLHKNILIGQTKSGKLLSDEECRNILSLSVSKCEERDNIEQFRLGSLLVDFDGLEPLETRISKEDILKDYFKRKQGSIAFEVERLKLIAGRKKSSLEVHIKELKNDIAEAKKQIEAKNIDRLEELQLTKQVKLLEKELRKQENDLFFDLAQVDVDTEKAISDLTNEYNFQVKYFRRFKIQVYGSK